MRIKVKVDVRKPLKKERRVRQMGGDWWMVNFKYEKLGVFCFFCGHLGHSEQKCEMLFSKEEDDGVRGWSAKLRVEPRRAAANGGGRWLKEERELRQNQNANPVNHAHMDIVGGNHENDISVKQNAAIVLHGRLVRQNRENINQISNNGVDIGDRMGM